MLWDTESIAHFLYRFFPQYVQSWHSLRKHERDMQGLVKQVDMARYLIIQIYGGCYFDTDTEPTSSLEKFWDTDIMYARAVRGVRSLPEHLPSHHVDWSSYDFLLSADNWGAKDNLSTVTNCAILSIPGVKFWQQVVEHGLPRKDGKVLTSFGTWALTDLLRVAKQQKLVRALVLPSFYFNWVPHHMDQDPPEWNVCLHHNDISWGDDKLKVPWQA